MVKCVFFRKLKFLKIQKIKTKDLFQDNIQHFFFENGNWIYLKNRVISAQPKLELKSSKISFSFKIFKTIIFDWRFRIFKFKLGLNFSKESFLNENFECSTPNVTFSHLFYWIITFQRHPTVEFQIFFLHFKFFLFEFLNFHFLWKKSRIFDISSKIDITYKIYV